MSADDRVIHNASCENRTPCLTPVILPWDGVNWSLNIQCLRNRGYARYISYQRYFKRFI